MIQHALHNDSYLDAAKYYEKVWQTPSIKEDVNGKGKAVSVVKVCPTLQFSFCWRTLGTRTHYLLCSPCTAYKRAIRYASPHLQ